MKTTKRPPELMRLEKVVGEYKYLTEEGVYYSIEDKKFARDLAAILTELLKEIDTEEEMPDQISLIWGIDDVKSVAEDLTDQECREVLQLIKAGHDANFGTNWDTVESAAEEVREEAFEAGKQARKQKKDI